MLSTCSERHSFGAPAYVLPLLLLPKHSSTRNSTDHTLPVSFFQAMAFSLWPQPGQHSHSSRSTVPHQPPRQGKVCLKPLADPNPLPTPCHPNAQSGSADLSFPPYKPLHRNRKYLDNRILLDLFCCSLWSVL